MNETPKILLYNSKKVSYEEKCKKDEIYEKVLMEYLRRQLIEMQEVECYYENQKRELAIIQKEKRQNHANEMITCPHCKSMVTRTNLSKHKKSTKCITFVTDEPEDLDT
jgi:hypothetical protein